ncbi:MAG: hypothetical protein HQL91_12505 [Magnetococcales bacterium]|nr:hypothetical protein [Magnetococcales bacterium]
MSNSSAKKMKKCSKSEQKHQQDKKVRRDHIVKNVNAIGPLASKKDGISGALIAP